MTHNSITHREWHVIIVFILTTLIVILSGISQQTMNDYELLWLIFFVTPIGLYIATDPERRRKS